MTLNLARSGCRIITKKKTFKGNPVCLGRVATLRIADGVSNGPCSPSRIAGRYSVGCGCLSGKLAAVGAAHLPAISVHDPLPFPFIGLVQGDGAWWIGLHQIKPARPDLLPKRLPTGAAPHLCSHRPEVICPTLGMKMPEQSVRIERCKMTATAHDLDSIVPSRRLEQAGGLP